MSSTYARSAIVIVVSIGLTFALVESRVDWSPMHKWNRAVGDVSLFLFALTMAIGPLVRLWSRARSLLPWRRELGIQTAVFAAIHTVIILAGWVEWDLIQLFGYVVHPQTGGYVMIQHGFGLANAIGIAALLYVCLLALTSNNVSQRLLGGSVWKHLQQSAYVLWALVVVHTAYFLYLHFQHFHQPVPEPNWLQMPFVLLVLAVLVLQGAATAKVWRNRTRTNPRRQFEGAA